MWYQFRAFEKTTNPPSSPFVKRGKSFLLPLEKGGGEGFYEVFYKVLNCYQFSKSKCLKLLFVLNI